MRKFLKYFSISLVALVILFFVFRNTLFSMAVDTYVDTLNEAEFMPFRIQYEKFGFDPVYGTLELRQLQLTPKETAANQNLELRFTAQAIEVNGLDVKKIYRKNLEVSSVEFKAPDLVYYMQVDETGKMVGNNDSTEEAVPVPWMDILEGTRLDHLVFTDGNVKVFKVYEDTSLFLNLQGYHINVHGADTIDNSILDLTRENYIAFDSLTFDMSASHVLRTGYMKLDLVDRSLELEDVFMDHKQKMKEHIYAQKFKKEWLELRAKKVWLEGMDFGQLEKINFHVDEVVIQELDMTVSEKFGLKRPAGFQGKMINDWFMSIPPNLDFNSIRVEDSDILYELHDAPFEGDMIIPIAVNALKVEIDQGDVYVDARGMIYSSPLYLKVHAMADSSYRTNVSASIKSMNKKWLTELFEPFAGVQFVQGDHISLDFYYSYAGQNAYTNGTMDFKYQNLKLNVLKRKKHEQNSLVFSFAANTLVKKNNFPGKKGYVKAPLTYRKEKYRGFLGHLVFTMLEGIQYSATKKK